MPQIRTYSGRQVQLQQPQAPGFTARATPEDYGAGAAEAMGQLGNAFGKAGDAAFKIAIDQKIRQEKVEVSDALNNFRQDMRSLDAETSTGPGYLNRLGKEALGSTESAQKDYEKLARTYGKGFLNQRQQASWKLQSSYTIRSKLDSIATHERRQTDAYERLTQESDQINNRADVMDKLYSETPGELQNAMAIWRGSVNTNFPASKYGAKTNERKMREAEHELHWDIAITKMNNNDVDTLKWWEENQHFIVPSKRGDLGRRIKDRAGDLKVKTVVDGWLDDPGAGRDEEETDGVVSTAEAPEDNPLLPDELPADAEAFRAYTEGSNKPTELTLKEAYARVRDKFKDDVLYKKANKYVEYRFSQRAAEKRDASERSMQRLTSMIADGSLTSVLQLKKESPHLSSTQYIWYEKLIETQNTVPSDAELSRIAWIDLGDQAKVDMKQKKFMELLYKMTPSTRIVIANQRAAAYKNVKELTDLDMQMDALMNDILQPMFGNDASMFRLRTELHDRAKTARRTQKVTDPIKMAELANEYTSTSIISVMRDRAKGYRYYQHLFGPNQGGYGTEHPETGEVTNFHNMLGKPQKRGPDKKGYSAVYHDHETGGLTDKVPPLRIKEKTFGTSENYDPSGRNLYDGAGWSR